MLLTIHDPEHWRDRAREARSQAGQMTDPEAKRQLLEIAAIYEKLATLAEGKKA